MYTDHSPTAHEAPANPSIATPGGAGGEGEELAVAFAPLLAYDTRLYNVAFRILRDRDDALDAVQEAYLQAFKGFRGFRGDAQPYTWLCRITLNECARRGGKRTARRKREVELAVMEERGVQLPVEDPAFQQLDVSRSTRAVSHAVRDLPPIYRDVVNLRYFDHMSYGEVANVCACPVGTVKSRLSRAHARLKGQLVSVLLSEFV